MINLNEINNFFAIGIPETVTLTVLTIILLKLKIKWKTTCFIGLITALAILVLRVFNTGIHPAVSMIVIALLVAYFYRVPKLNALIASVICFLILNFFELAGFLVLKGYLSLDIKDIAQNSWLWVSFAWGKIILLALTALLISKTNWYRGKSYVNTHAPRR